MDRTRITISIEVDLDPIPGAFHTPENALEHVQWILTRSFADYNPIATISEK